MNIAIKRSAALGDVLSCTPIPARFRQRFPKAHIVFHTHYVNIFENSPHVNECNANHKWDILIDLDGAHETRRSTNHVDAYMEAAFGDHGDENTDKSVVFNFAKKHDYWKKMATIHPNKSWDNRTMPNSWWDEVASGLIKAGYTVVVLGTKIDYCPDLTVFDTRDQFSLQEQASAIDASDIFVAGQSGLLMLAAATNTPVVVPLTISTPQRGLPYRWGAVGRGFHFVQAATPCQGCDAHAPSGATWVGCQSPLKGDTPDYECVRTIKAKDVIELALKEARQ